jgi:glycosyltransferase involved in cell wall biosynthesis
MTVNLGGRTPDVLDFHNIEAELMMARTAHYTGVKLVGAQVEVRRLAHLERTAARRARLVTACSAHDVRVLRAAGARVLHIPNGVSTIPAEWTPPPEQMVVGFVGSMDYAPNREAVEWLADDVWGRITAINGEAKLLIAGRNAGALGDLVADMRNTSILDSPASIDTAYHQSDLCIVPLLSGAGTKIKLLEAMAYGRSVVTTSVGLEGLEHLSELVTTADDPEHFATAVATRARSGVASEGRRNFDYAHRRFGWPAQFEELSARISSERRLGIL